MVPVEDGLRHAAPAEVDALHATEDERRPGRRRTAAGEPADPATLKAGARPSAPRLPHEHDENADPPQAPRQPIIQAERDLNEGRQDTDLRGKAREVFDRATRRR